MAIKIIINDIDGSTFHCVTSGTVDEVRAEYGADHPVQSLITDAIAHGQACATYEIDGDEYTTKVIAKDGDE